MGGKGVSSGVASAESLFDEARAIAVGQRTRSRVLIAKELTNNPADNLRRIVVASAQTDATGNETSPTKWILSSRGIVLPDQVFFSQDHSKRDHQSGGTIQSEPLVGVSNSYLGTYYIYEFNAEGICTTGITPTGYKAPSFVIGAGARSVTPVTSKPKVTSAGKRDFGGFIVWRNGRTSAFRSPTQIDNSITSIAPGTEF
jgi:hypothetical protein